MKFLQSCARALLLGGVLFVGSAPVRSSAQDAAKEPAGAQSEDAAESRSAAFQAVEGPLKEDVPGGPLLVGAYGFILVLLVAYVARLGGLYAKNRGELERLTQAIERGRKG